MQKIITHRLTLFFLFTAMILAIGFPADTRADSCQLFSESFSGTSGHTWKCGTHGACNISGKLELTQPESGYWSFGTTGFVPMNFFTIDVDITEVPLFALSNSPKIGIYTFTTGDLFFSILNVTTDGFAAVYYPEIGRISFMFWDVIAGEWQTTQDQAVTGPVTSIGMTVLIDKVVFRVNRKDTGFSLPGVFTMPEVIDTLWLMASGSYTAVTFDNVCASLNSAPSPTPSPVPSPRPTPTPSPMPSPRPSPMPSPRPTPSPMPSPAPTGCIATIDGNLLLHIPYISYINPMLGTLSLWTDFVYEFNPTFILFKLIKYGVISNPLCTASTLSDDLKIHIPDVLLPDGSTHLWVDLEYGSALSTDGNAYFIVTKYGFIPK